MAQTIYIKENEKDVFEALKKQGIKTHLFEKHFDGLFRRVYNNEVGYYLFKQDATLYKIIVLPKSIEPSQSAEREFVDYLLHYYRINNKHHFDKAKKIPESLLKLAFQANHSEDRSHALLSEFQFHRYQAIIQSIEEFFKRHKNFKRIKVDYTSQSIKHKLNLSRNIKELDKSKIHQTQSKDVIFSHLATVTHSGLSLFMRQKYNGLSNNQKLFLEIKNLQTMLRSKYKIKQGYKLSLATLSGIKISKLFSKSSEQKQLLVDIKSLFGFEQMYKDDAISINHREDLQTTSLFINPNEFYEWYVYDILKAYCDANEYKIYFKSNSNKTKYKLQSTQHNESQVLTSNPDFVITDEAKNIKIVLDAKWKNIDSMNKIERNDFLKLWHDSQLLESDYNTISYLIYPNYPSYSEHLKILHDEAQFFDFGILQIDMNFNEIENPIDFKYDYQKIEEKIEKEKEVKKIQTDSEELTNEINAKRTKLIEQLLNSDEVEDKEEVFGSLDKALMESSQTLSEQLEQKISPEIISILETYRDILEVHSIKFLKSSSIIYNYYKDKNYEHFDYSMPGSGLWKLIELELNTSFSWFLRIKSNICNNSCPWTSIASSRRTITQDLENGKKVRLNQFDHQDNGKLQGVMLGGISLLLQDSGTIEEFYEISSLDRDFFVEQLNDFISAIITIRNEHAHIKAMSLEKFEELYKLLFGVEDNIKKLLDMKKIIISSIKGTL